MSGIIMDKARVVIADLAEGKRQISLKGGVREGPTTTILSQPMLNGVHTADFYLAACKEVKGGVFLGMADQDCPSSRPLGDRDAGFGWGSHMPYVGWTDKYVDGWIAGRPYPHYKTRLDHIRSYRHDMYQIGNKEVQERLIRWGLRNHLRTFAASGMDGRELEQLHEGRMEADLNMQQPHERAKLADRIKELFQEELSYTQGDLVRLRFDADAGELSFFKCNSPLPPEWEGAAWAPVGEPLGGLKGRLLCMACTIYHDKDKIEWRVGAKPPPAMPQGPDLFAAKPTAPRGVFPAISDWRYAQGKGTGQFARDDFTVLRHAAFGTTIELMHTSDGSIQILSTDIYEGENMYHVQMVPPACDRTNLSEWRAPEVVERARSLSASFGLYGHQQGIEWGYLGKIGGARAVSDTCFCGNWLVQPERGVAEAWEPFHLRYGSVVINIESKVSPVKLTLTASGLVAVNSLTVGEGGAVVCARGKAARVVKVEEGRVARTVDDTGPEKVEVQHWRRDHQIVPPCPSSSAVSRELQYGGNVGIVPIPSGGAACGNDAMTNYNYTAQRAWTADAIRRERKAAGFGQAHRAAGFLAESHYDVERRLRERRAKVAVAERLAEARVGTLERETGMTGHGPRKDRDRAMRLRAALTERQARHQQHEADSRAAVAARFPVKGTGGNVTLHGPGQVPFGSWQAVSRRGAGDEPGVLSVMQHVRRSCSRSRDENWMRRIGRPGGSAGSVSDPWGQKRWELKGEWLNLRPPIDRFKPTGA